MTAPLDLAAMRARHIPSDDTDRAYCRSCLANWPCDADRLLRERERVENWPRGVVSNFANRFVRETGERTIICMRCNHEWDGHDRYHRWPIRLRFRRSLRFFPVTPIRLYSRHGWQTGVDRHGRRIFGWTLTILWLQVHIGPSLRARFAQPTVVCPKCEVPRLTVRPA